MGAGNHGGFGNTSGHKNNHNLIPLNLQFFASRVYEKGGHISEESFKNHREYFLGKSVKRIEKDLQQQGYKTHIVRSVHKKSKAKRIIVENGSKEKNVAVVQVSPGSKRHGETAYVKVSTTDSGIFKVVSKKETYITDGKEKAKIFFARRREKK